MIDRLGQPTGNAGGKGKNLHKLFNEFNVPKGFVLTTEFFEKDFDHEHVLAHFNELDATKVAVRSSGSAEDLADASFAGQHDTVLNVNKENLIPAIQQVVGSLHSERAVAYRKVKGIDQSVQMAVVVQEMVDSDVSGVMYSKNPVNNKNEIVIEASHGLGELVVSGKVEPDHILVTPRGIEYTEGSKNMAMTSQGIVANENKQRALNDQHVKQLSSLAVKLEKFFGAPQDIEFAIKDGEIFVLQSRNLTTL